MRTLILLLFFILLISGTTHAQSNFIQWQKSLGGTGSDQANSIIQTTDGGYIVAGFSYSNDGDVTGNHGLADYWIVKLDSIGNTLWTKALGGTGDDRAQSITQTSDGGCIVAGNSESNDGDVTGNNGGQAYWIVKLDSIGDTLWTKVLGGDTGNESAYSITQTSDGGYIVAGHSDSNDGDVSGNHGGADYWIVKLNSIGDTLWTKALGGTVNDYAHSITQTSDGGYIVAGSSYSNDGDVTSNHGINDYWIAKLDSIGDILWTKALGGTVDDYAYSITQTNDGGYIVAGYANSNDGDVTGNHGGRDYWIVKLDSIGDTLWTKALGGTVNDYAHSIIQTGDGGYIVAGYVHSNDGDVSGNHGGADYWIVKLDSIGDTLWTKTLGGGSTDIAYSITQTSDGGYIVAGSSYSNDGDVTGNHGFNDYWIVKLSCLQVNAGNGVSIVCGVSVNLNASISYEANSSTIYSYQWSPSTGLSDTTVSNPIAFPTSTTTYTVTVSNGLGCVEQDSVVVTVNPFTVNATVNNPTITCGDTTILNASFNNSASYLWAPSSGLNNPNIQNPTAIPSLTTTYTVTATIPGCVSSSDTVTLYVTYADTNQICLITVDSTSTKNVIVWEKTISTVIDSFKIYREITTNNYKHIGNVAYSDLSEYTDNDPGINPNTTNYKYKIAVLDTCGNESTLSDFHKTIHLVIFTDVNNDPVLSWTDYEGFLVDQYRIMRDDFGTGNWQAIDSVSAGTIIYIDPTPPTDSSVYRIEAVPPYVCTATAKSKNYNKSRSNFQNKLGTTDIDNQSTIINNQLKIFPNPYTGKTNISYTLLQNTYVSLEIYNIIGKKIHTLANENQNEGKYQYEFSASEQGYNPGIYLLKFTVYPVRRNGRTGANETNNTKLLLELK